MPRTQASNRRLLRNILYSVKAFATGYIDFGSSATYNVTNGTVAFWVKVNEFTNTRRYFSLGFTNSNNDLSIYSTGTGRFGVYQTVGGSTKINATAVANTVPKNEWFHLAVGWDATNLKIWVNGVNVYTNAGDRTLGYASNPTFRVGQLSYATGFPLPGAYTNIVFCNDKMTDQQVLDLMNVGTLPSSAVSYWAGQDATGTSVTLTSGAGNNGTLSSTAAWSTDSVMTQRRIIENLPYSLVLNGTSQYGNTSSGVAMSSATKLTVAGWFRFNGSTGAAQVPASTLTAGGGGNAFEIQFDNTAVASKSFIFLVTRGATTNYSSSGQLEYNKWYRFVGVYDGSLAAASRTTVYVNGQRNSTNQLAGNTTGGFDDNTLYLGNRNSGALYQKGATSELEIYPGVAWTAQEIQNDYFASVAPSGSTPAAKYNFTEGNGTSVADSSGNGYNLSLSGTPAWSIDSPAQSRLSIRSFPYSLQFVRASSSRSSIPYVNLGSNLSYTAWIRPRLNGNAADVIGMMDTLVRISPTDIKFYTDGTLGNLASVAFNWEHNKLYHLAVTASGTTIKFYINGSLLATKTASGAIDTSDTSNFIGYYGIAAQAFEGEMAEVTAYSRTLTDAEIAAMYFQNVVPTTNLERYYKFATGSGTTAVDSSGNAQNGTIVAGTWQPGFFAGRTGPASWSPADLLPWMWLRADLGITLNGSNVSDWADQSGNSRDIAQATAANQPLYNATGIGSQPSVDFDGIDDLLFRTNTYIDGPMTIAVVFELISLPASSSFAAMVGMSNSAGGNQSLVLLCDYAGYQPYSWSFNQGAFDLSVGCADALDTNKHFFLSYYNNGGASTPANYTASLDNTAKTVVASDAFNAGIYMTGFCLGTADVASFLANSKIAEIIILDRALTAGEETNLAAYVTSRYGI